MMRRTKIIAAIALLIIAALIAGLAVRRLLSSGYAQRAAVVLNQGDVTTAITLAARSQSIELTEENLLLGVAVDLTQMQNLLNATTTPQDQMAAVRTQFQNLLSESLAQAQAASAQNPQDYQPYLALANIYELVLPLKITGAYENARQVYAKAMDLNPTNPTLPLLLARLEANQDLKGNLADITRLIEQAETLKNNYTDAYLFAEQVAVSMNDLPGATAAARAALQSAPDQAPLWFELGLLYYSGANYTDAVAALEQAVSMTPQYANAKYFLGLAYYKENRLAEATRQFEDLVQTNSDNAEVKLILENLKAGKDPFAGAQPPITSNPAQRQQAPIKE